MEKLASGYCSCRRTTLSAKVERSIECHIEEELEARDGGINGSVGNALLHHVQLVAAQILCFGCIRGPFKKLRELHDGPDVLSLRLRQKLAQRHIFDHSLPQWTDGFGRLSHGSFSCVVGCCLAKHKLDPFW
jgi:hypothetical protein